MATSLAAGSESTVEIPLKPDRRGWFDVRFRLLESGQQLLERDTTFAVLPQDSRRATLHDSPFGTWYFGTAHRGSPLDQAGPLMQKAGIRNTLERGTSEEMKQYGLKLVQFGSIVGTHTVDEVRRQATKSRFDSWPDTDQALVFHESNIGPIMTHPAFLLDKKPEPLNESTKHYGYDDKRVSVSYEWTYHSTSPGNNSEHTASDLNIRDCLLALAYGVPQVNPALIHDVGNAYYFSKWGASGLCRRPPELNPKPGYVSFATMTLMLDQAEFLRHWSIP